jgi:hypothetical protein
MSRTRSRGALLLAAVGFAAPVFAQRGSEAAPRASEEPQSVAVPARPLDPASLRALFLDLLGRPPHEDERERWSGRPRHELADALLGSEEFWGWWLEEQLYYFFLIDNFRPEGERVAAIPSALARAELDVREAIHRIALSPSFDQRNPGADTYVTVVMEQFNGIEVQKSARELEVGKRIYDGAAGTFLGKNAASQSDLLRVAIEHRSFAETFLEREHRRLVRGAPEPRAFADWVRRFQREPSEYASVVREWLLSPAWDERVAHEVPMPNRLFVRALFVDLLGRTPDPDEARRIRSALDGLADPGPLRSVLARLVVDSGSVELPERDAIEDPTRWIAELFRRHLGREASELELKEFVGAFHDPACRPETVLVAIVTGAEYQSF